MVSEADRPVALDLFSGAGGLSLGLEAAGFDIAGGIDIDPIHCATHDLTFLILPQFVLTSLHSTQTI